MVSQETKLRPHTTISLSSREHSPTKTHFLRLRCRNRGLEPPSLYGAILYPAGIRESRPGLVSSLICFLNENITPVIPLRDSISASRDLIPLSYIASALQGSSEAEVWINDDREALRRRRVTADEAVAKIPLAPLKLAPKEGLALVNGTAVSAGVGSLALHDAHGLVVLSQVLTAMGVEALRGDVDSFDPFLSDIRRHIGQKEVSSNLRQLFREVLASR